MNPKIRKKPNNSPTGGRRLRRVVRAQMTINEDGTASFHVRGYDFRFADLPISVNGYLFAPVRPDNAISQPSAVKPLKDK